MKLHQYMDHTLLKQDATKEQVEKLIQEAKEYHFKSVCINPTWVTLASQMLKDTDIEVCTVIGFPLGANTSETKAFETENAVANGATEVDMVINVGALKSKNDQQVLEDIKAVVNASGEALVKVIIETCLLTDEEKRRACQLAQKAGADYVKTSTGFSSGGATVEDIRLMRETVGEDMGVKASGGVHTYDEAVAMVEAGASRIGASASINIVNGEH